MKNIDPVLRHVFETAQDLSSVLVVLSLMGHGPIYIVASALPINIEFWVRYG